MKGALAVDPRGLMHEAYRMELTPQDCRSIFLDWALGLPEGGGQAETAALLAHYADRHPDHPMTALLREGLRDPAPARRRPRRRPGREPGP